MEAEPDFQTFQVKLLLSLKQDAPLDENLRAVMLPTLAKLRRYSRAKVAIHSFVNPELGELHVMIAGTGSGSRRAVYDELLRRHGLELDRVMPRSQLPGYVQMSLPSGSDIPGIFSPAGDVRAERLSGQLAWFIEAVSKLSPDEFAGTVVKEGDVAVVVPLGSGPYRRLGCIILWGEADAVAECVEDPRMLEGLIGYRRSLEQLLIGVFSSFYQMEPHTYLPPYYKVEQKPVALLCAEIREFDRIAEILRLHRDLDQEEAAHCLRRLVNRFSESAAEVIHRHKGRLDQMWGNGLVAIFGEYLDTTQASPTVACMRAVSAAAELVEEFSKVAEVWLRDDFNLGEFLRFNSEWITLAPAVAVDYGRVVFDYVGSPKRRMYMAVGDHVNFVKQLVTLAGTTEVDHGDTEVLLRQVLAALRRDPSRADELHAMAPILLSQAAYTWSSHVLKERPYAREGTVRRARAIRLPGKPARYSVYELWPENVNRAASPLASPP